MKVAERVRVRGPLVPYVEGFTAALTAQGYTDLSMTKKLHLVAHLSRWLARREIAPEQIAAHVAEQFMADRRRTHTGFRSVQALEELLQYLRSLGVVRAAATSRLERSLAKAP